MQLSRIEKALWRSCLYAVSFGLPQLIFGWDGYPVKEVPESLGKELEIVGRLNVGPCFDAALHRGILYVIGGGSIHSFATSDPRNPAPLGKLSGLGNVRQIEIQDGFAYIVSREEGLFIVDVGDPSAMKLAAHYDTLELATGISVSGVLAAVSNRQYGVEFIDISNPRNPHYLSTARTGEAQSAFISGSYAYVGDWGPLHMSICDLSDPLNPKIVSQIPLDGYGDGVFVRGNLAYAATGHHAPKTRLPRPTQLNQGHGLQVIDVGDPQNPETLSVIKFPGFYQRSFDWWDVRVSGNYAFVGDSEGGVYVVDIGDPRELSIIGRAVLPKSDMTGYVESVFEGDKKSGPVGGLAVGDGVVYIAGNLSDLFIFEAEGWAAPLPEHTTDFRPEFNRDQDGLSASVYQPRGQVHAAVVSPAGDKAWIAAGYGGVHEVQLAPELRGKKILDTGSIVFDLYFRDDLLYLAEGHKGFSVWRRDSETVFELLGQYVPTEGGVYQLSISPNGDFAYLHVGVDIIDFVDISDPARMLRFNSDEQGGNFYRLPLHQGFLDGRYVGACWHRPGCVFYDLEPRGDGQVLSLPNSLINGVAVLDNPPMALITYKRGYVLQNLPDQPQLDVTKPILIEDTLLEGKPSVHENRLYVADRMRGDLTAVDISDRYAPVRLWHRLLKGNPGLISQHDDMLVVPAGRDGLHLLNAESGLPFYGEGGRDDSK